MNLNFAKMHGAGNDFVVINNSDRKCDITKELIRKVCHRRRCIGGDGFIAVIKPEEGTEEYNVIMEYYNCDGSRGEMCGNGLRCAAYYAHKIIGLPDKLKIKTDAGILEAEILGEEKVKISIPVISEFQEAVIDGYTLYYGNTGVPHAVVCVDDIDNYDVHNNGSKLRYNSFFPKGTNVNFVKPDLAGGEVKIRTYERGVEMETLACGTGISASAISMNKFLNFPKEIFFETRENDRLIVNIPDNEGFKMVYLTGPAVIAFKGAIDI